MATPGGWRRPANVPIPTTWARFRGLRPMANGRVPEFWVQDVPDDMLEAVLDIMIEHFTQDSPFSRALNIRGDPISMAETRIYWQKQVEARVSLVALTDGEDGKPVIAGCNVMTVYSSKDPPHPQARGRVRRIIDEALDVQDRRANVLRRWGVDHGLYATGLLVLPDFRGQGIGLELLKARDPLCRALRLPISYTVFTGAAAQKLAERVGFRSVDEQNYADYRDAEGNAVFAASHERCYKLMVKDIPSEEQDEVPG